MEKVIYSFFLNNKKEKGDIEIVELHSGKKGKNIVDVLLHGNAVEGNGLRATFGRLSGNGRLFQVIQEDVIHSRSEAVEKAKEINPRVRLIKFIDFPK